MVSSYTTNKSIEKPASGDYVNTWATPVNADWDIIDKAFGGITTLNVTAVSGTVVLISAQYQPLILSVTGTLTANVNYQIPSTVGGQWIVANKTTGAYTVTISSGGGGTSVVVPQGYNTVVASDGTNIALANSAPVTAAGSNTQIQYNSSGYLGASANLTFDGTTFAVTGAATVSTTLGVTGAATLSSTLAVTGAITGSGTVTGTALIPSGSSVPANGVYLPAANTVGVASNTTERLRIDSTGAWGLAGTNYGTSGQVLTSAGSGAPPTWTTPTAGGGTSIASGSLSGTSLVLTSIPSTYAYIVLQIFGVSFTATTTPTLRASTDNGSNYDSTATNYRGIRTTSAGSTAMSQASIIESASMASNETFNITVRIAPYQGGTYAQFTVNMVDTAGSSSSLVSGIYKSTSAINALQFAGGTFDAGTYALYGYS
jgi:hypothetical protein